MPIIYHLLVTFLEFKRVFMFSMNENYLNSHRDGKMETSCKHFENSLLGLECGLVHYLKTTNS